MDLTAQSSIELFSMEGQLVAFDSPCDVAIEDPEEDFPKKLPALVAILNEAQDEHTAQLIVWSQDEGIVFQTPLFEALLPTQLIASSSAKTGFKVKHPDRGDSVDIVLPSSEAADGLACAIVAAACKSGGCVNPITLPINRRDSRRNAQVVAGSLVEVSVICARLNYGHTMQLVTDDAKLDPPFELPSLPVKLILEVPDVDSTTRRVSDPITLGLADANEGLKFAVCIEVNASNKFEWLTEVVGGEAAEKRLWDGKACVLSVLCVVGGTAQEDPEEVRKAAIKKRLQRQGGSSMMEGPNSANNSFAGMAAAAATRGSLRGSKGPGDEGRAMTPTTTPERHEEKQTEEIPAANAEEPTEEDEEAAAAARRKERKERKRRERREAEEAAAAAAAAAEADDEIAALEAVATGSGPTSPTSPSDPTALLGTGELSPKDAATVEGKLDRKKQRLLNFEAELLTLQDDLKHRENLLEARNAEISTAESTLRTRREQMDMERDHLNKQETSLRRRERDSDRRDRQSEKTPLLGSANAPASDAAFTFRVEHQFYDKTALPPMYFERYPIAAWFVHYGLHRMTAVFLVVLAVAGIALSGFDFGSTWPAVAMTALSVAFYLTSLFRSVKLIDLLHLVDQSCTSTSDPVEVQIYIFVGTFAAVPIVSILASLASISAITAPLATIPRVGLILALMAGALTFGIAFCLFLFATYSCRERIAQTVPHQHGAVSSKLNLRASLARYQYLKSVCIKCSRAWTPETYFLSLIVLYGILFAVYNITLRRDEQLVTFSSALLSTCVFTASSVIGTVLIFAITGWEEATRQVVGTVGTHLERWSRGDHNHDTDARADDYVTLQSALVMAIQGRNHPRWGLQVPLGGGRLVNVPDILQAVAVVLLLAGTVLIPIVAAYHVNNLS